MPFKTPVESPLLSHEIYHLKRENNPYRQDAITFSCLGKLDSVNISTLKKWENLFSQLLKDSRGQKEISRKPLVIGLTESGIIPAAIIHHLLRAKKIRAKWICTTRRCLTDGLQFRENHSHSPAHTLILPQEEFTELIIVEDELTTGQTLLNLILKLCNALGVRKVRFLILANSLIDNKFFATLHAERIEYTFHSLWNFVPKNASTKNDPKPSSTQNATNDLTERVENYDASWLYPQHRPALNAQLDATLALPTGLSGTVLTVGETVDLAFRFILLNPHLSFRHITLSPWLVDGSHIIERDAFCNKFYLYNSFTLALPVYFLCDPIDNIIGRKIEQWCLRKNIRTTRLFQDVP